MKAQNFLLNFLNRVKSDKKLQTRLMIFGSIGLVSLLFLYYLLDAMNSNQSPRANNVTWLTNKPQPQKDLDYDFVRIDTLEIPNFPRADKPEEKVPLVETPRQPQRQPQRRTQPQPRAGQPSSRSVFPKSRGGERNPNMIIMNNIAENPVASGTPGSPSRFAGNQSSLIKVVLPNRTPVADGSLVEARVLHDSQWGDVRIPRRAKLIGVATLFNRRVNVDFRQIVIDGNSRSCGGRAYDIKRLQGIPYSPVNSETKRLLWEELRSAVAGVPVVGRAANRTRINQDLNRDVAELEEGLEFYALITSIF